MQLNYEAKRGTNCVTILARCRKSVTWRETVKWSFLRINWVFWSETWLLYSNCVGYWSVFRFYQWYEVDWHTSTVPSFSLTVFMQLNYEAKRGTNCVTILARCLKSVTWRETVKWSFLRINWVFWSATWFLYSNCVGYWSVFRLLWKITLLRRCTKL